MPLSTLGAMCLDGPDQPSSEPKPAPCRKPIRPRPSKTAEIRHSDRPLIRMPKPLVFCIGGKQAIQSVQDPDPKCSSEACRARPSGIRRPFRPYIEDVDDRLPDLIPE
jgi:hypothetical protein